MMPLDEQVTGTRPRRDGNAQTVPPRKPQTCRHVRWSDWQITLDSLWRCAVSEIFAFQAVVIVCLTAGFLGSLRFLSRYLELRRERSIPVATDGLRDRLDRIEVIVEATALEVERIAEGNRFMAKLLAERSGAAGPASRPERVITPH